MKINLNKVGKIAKNSLGKYLYSTYVGSASFHISLIFLSPAFFR